MLVWRVFVSESHVVRLGFRFVIFWLSLRVLHFEWTFSIFVDYESAWMNIRKRYQLVRLRIQVIKNQRKISLPVGWSEWCVSVFDILSLCAVWSENRSPKKFRASCACIIFHPVCKTKLFSKWCVSKFVPTLVFKIVRNCFQSCPKLIRYFFHAFVLYRVHFYICAWPLFSSFCQ